MKDNVTPSEKKGFMALFTNNTVLKIVALLAGILIWAMLSNANDPIVSKPLPIPITYQYEDKLLKEEELKVISAPSTISITVSYHQSDASKISASMFTCTADLMNHSGGDLNSQRVYISVTQVSGRNYVTDWSYPKNDPTVAVSMDNYITKTFTIQPMLENDLPEGLLLDPSVTFEPSTITVSGPLSQFSSLASVRARVDLQELSQEGGGNITKEISLALYDANDRVITNENLTMSRDKTVISAVLKRITTASIRLEGVTGEPAYGIRYLASSIIPDRVTVLGLKSTLADLSDITIPADAIDISGITENTSFLLDIRNYMPDGVEFAGDDPSIEVMIYVEKLETRVIQIPPTDIHIRNQKDNCTYELSSSTLLLRVKGFAEDLEVLNVASLEPSIDVTGLSDGRYRVKVDFVGLAGYTLENGDSLYTYVDVIEETEATTPEESTTEPSTSSEEEDTTEPTNSQDSSLDESDTEPTTVPEETSASASDEPDTTTSESIEPSLQQEEDTPEETTEGP